MTTGLGANKHFLSDVGRAISVHKGIAVGSVAGIENIEHLKLKIYFPTPLEWNAFVKPNFAEVKRIKTAVLVAGIIKVLATGIFVHPTKLKV